MIEMEPEYLNTGVMTKVDHLVQDGLSEPVARRLREAAGPDWLEKMNVRFKYSGNNAVKEVQGCLNWDFNKLLHGVEFLGDCSSRDKRMQWTARQLISIRNAKSHGSTETIQSDASFIRTFEFLRLATDILKYFGARKQLEELNELTEKINKSIGYRGAAVPPTDTPSTAEERPTPEPSTPPEQPPKATAAVGDEAIPGRATPLPPPGPGSAWFPIVGEGIGDFGYFLARRLPETDPKASFYAPGLAQNKREVFQRVIDATRADEKDDVVSAATTRIRMDPGQFSGLSFGLAAAIADRTARYGRAAAFEKATIIATGIVLAQRHGEVGAIDQFSAKIALIDSSPATKDLADVLFVFPSANLDDDPACRTTLAKWSAGGRIRWRAVRHLDELDDLLALGDSQGVVSRSEGPAPAPSKVDAKATTEAPLSQASAPASASKPQVVAGPVYRNALLFGGTLGLVILVGAAILSTWVLGAKPDPMLVQASDDRIHAAIVASEGTIAAPADPDRCRLLSQKTAMLTDFDRSRLTGETGSTISSAAECRSRFEASDGRLALLVGAVEKYDRGEGTADDAARALQALTAFDTARSLDASQTYAIDRGKQAVGDIDASRRRIDELAGLWTTKSEAPEKEYTLSLRTALSGLTMTDLARADGTQRTAIEAARTYLDGLDLSDRRIGELRNAVLTYEAAPDASHARTCVATLDAMTAADKRRLAPEDVGIIAKAASCGAAMKASQARFDALMSAHSVLKAAEAKGKGIEAALVGLKSAADAITKFDRPALSVDQEAALKAAEKVSQQLSESDQRISTAAAYAQAALLGQRRISGSFFKTLQQSIDDLTDLDYDRMDIGMQQQIGRACSLQPPLPPGSIAPVQSFTCQRSR
jgi:hypothetical protein